MKKDLRIHLNKLSAEVLESALKWQKLLKGHKVEKIFSINGKDVKGYTYEYPTVEKIQELLEAKAKQLQEKPANASTVKLPEPATENVGEGTGDTPEAGS